MCIRDRPRGWEKDEEVQISTEYNEFQILLHYILHNYMFYCFIRSYICLLYTSEQVIQSEQKQHLHRDLTGIHVLMAEDNDLNAELATIILEDAGMTVTLSLIHI